VVTVPKDDEEPDTKELWLVLLQRVRDFVLRIRAMRGIQSCPLRRGYKDELTLANANNNDYYL
jgi:hypothetical protein